MVSEKDLRPKWGLAVAASNTFAFTPWTPLGNHLISWEKSSFDLLNLFKFFVDLRYCQLLAWDLRMLADKEKSIIKILF